MSEWKTICEVDDIPPNGGRCALVGSHQVAVFRVYEANVQTFYAIDNRDPFSDGNVLYTFRYRPCRIISFEH